MLMIEQSDLRQNIWDNVSKEMLNRKRTVLSKHITNLQKSVRCLFFILTELWEGVGRRGYLDQLIFSLTMLSLALTATISLESSGAWDATQSLGSTHTVNTFLLPPLLSPVTKTNHDALLLTSPITPQPSRYQKILPPQDGRLTSLTVCRCMLPTNTTDLTTPARAATDTERDRDCPPSMWPGPVRGKTPPRPSGCSPAPPAPPPPGRPPPPSTPTAPSTPWRASCRGRWTRPSVTAGFPL